MSVVGTRCRVQGVSVSVSVLTLTAISLERYYAIVHPLRLRATPGRTRVTILAIWLVSAVLMVPELLLAVVGNPQRDFSGNPKRSGGRTMSLQSYSAVSNVILLII